jgi:glucose/arabinose dehydrogenase
MNRFACFNFTLALSAGLAMAPHAAPEASAAIPGVAASAAAPDPDPPPWTGPAPASPADFRRTEILSGLHLPMQFMEAPDGRLFIIQQTGEIILHDPAAGTTVTAIKLPVYHLNESGGLGVAVDPGFPAKPWIYASYNPTSTTFRVSRFTLAGSKLDPAGEKPLLEFPVTPAGHMGGGLAIGRDGDLFIAAGADNGPGPGVDAWLTAANTQDLRGKILRIRPGADGSAAIPSGNMFAATAATRPEIYSMGHRNPFKISADPRTGTIYVAEVGDQWEEMNQVKAPGNFGYPQYEGPSGGPMQNNNTAQKGLKVLPTAQPTWLTYQTFDPTVSRPPIPNFTVGGGAAIMAGPVCYFQPEAAAHQGLPSYYHRGLFWFDFNKGMIFHTRFDTAGAILGTREEFAGLGFKPTRASLQGDSIIQAGGSKTGLIDLKLGRYGNLYALEYWSGSLFRIDYTGKYPVAIRKGPSGAAVSASARPAVRILLQADGFRFSIPIHDGRAPDRRGAVRARIVDGRGRAVADLEIKAKEQDEPHGGVK